VYVYNLPSDYIFDPKNPTQSLIIEQVTSQVKIPMLSTLQVETYGANPTR